MAALLKDFQKETKDLLTKNTAEGKPKEGFFGFAEPAWKVESKLKTKVGKQPLVINPVGDDKGVTATIEGKCCDLASAKVAIKKDVRASFKPTVTVEQGGRKIEVSADNLIARGPTEEQLKADPKAKAPALKYSVTYEDKQKVYAATANLTNDQLTGEVGFPIASGFSAGVSFEYPFVKKAAEPKKEEAAPAAAADEKKDAPAAPASDVAVPKKEEKKADKPKKPFWCVGVRWACCKDTTAAVIATVVNKMSLSKIDASVATVIPGVELSGKPVNFCAAAFYKMAVDDQKQSWGLTMGSQFKIPICPLKGTTKVRFEVLEKIVTISHAFELGGWKLAFTADPKKKALGFTATLE